MPTANRHPQSRRWNQPTPAATRVALNNNKKGMPTVLPAEESWRWVPSKSRLCRVLCPAAAMWFRRAPPCRLRKTKDPDGCHCGSRLNSQRRGRTHPLTISDRLAAGRKTRFFDPKMELQRGKRIKKAAVSCIKPFDSLWIALTDC